MVFVAPQMLHTMDAPASAQAPAPVSDQDLVRQIEEMARQPAAQDVTPAAAAPAQPVPPKPPNDRASKKP